MHTIPVGRYDTDVTSSRAIYPSSKQSWYIALLIFSKCLHSFAIFLTYDLLRIFNVVSLIAFLKLLAGAVLSTIQEPRAQGTTLKHRQTAIIAQYAVLKNISNLFWFYGVKLCGPFRTVFLTQHHDVAIAAGLGAVFSGVGGPAVTRGVAMYLAAVFSLLFLDHDEGQEHPEGGHLFTSFGSWLGLADHKLGVLLLVVHLLIQIGVNTMMKRFAASIGGFKRLYGIVTTLEGAMLLPYVLLSISWERHSFLFVVLIFTCLLSVSVLLYVISFHIDSLCTQRLELPRVARIGSLSMFAFALCVSLLWGQTFFNGIGVSVADHVLSEGSILACILVILATLGLTSSSKSGARGSFIGYSAAGLPLYNLTNTAIQHTSRSVTRIATVMLKQVLADYNSRCIFNFLCLNLCFTMVEFLYGIWTNSLGLISDGFHMLFDCSALVMGLLASVMARWKPSKTFSYGYSRVEDLSGFVNGLFLLVISFFVFSEAIKRLFDPPTISTQRLLAVSVGGLCINLIGILAFRHSHSHGSDHGHHGHGHSHNANMQGVFLHIMADTLGSIGVIVSSLLIDQFGWYITDPICSIFIAVLIFVSVIPLLKHSALVLLLRTPEKLQSRLKDALDQVFSIEGVVSVKEANFWQHSSNSYLGSLHVQAAQDASEQNIIQQATSLLKQLGFTQLTVQVEKEEYLTHISGLSSRVRDSLVLVQAV